ncbi:MAG: ATPase [Alphaproteobacteria bacterium]|nr:ATPase [Alphaproteobacteria bacterium]
MVAVEERAGGFAVKLDHRPVKTPMRRTLVVPSPALARAIANEWEAQAETIRPQTMPIMRIAATAIDVVGSHRAEVAADIAGYGETDLVCYWAETPPDLAARQARLWQPLLDWAGDRYDARLAMTRGVVPINQPARALAALRRAVETADDWRLAGLAGVVSATGSLVIGLAVAAGRLDADAAFAASQVEETYEIERWGADAEASARRAERHGAMASAARYLALLEPAVRPRDGKEG